MYAIELGKKQQVSQGGDPLSPVSRPNWSRWPGC